MKKGGFYAIYFCCMDIYYSVCNPAENREKENAFVQDKTAGIAGRINWIGLVVGMMDGLLAVAFVGMFLQWTVVFLLMSVGIEIGSDEIEVICFLIALLVIEYFIIMNAIRPARQQMIDDEIKTVRYQEDLKRGRIILQEVQEEKSIEVVAGYPKNKDSLEADNSLQNSENIINNDEYENLKEGGSSGGIHGTYTYQLVDPPPSWSNLESYACWEALFLENGICQIDFCYNHEVYFSYEVPYTVNWNEGLIYLDNSEYLDLYVSNFESCAVEDVKMIGE